MRGLKEKNLENIFHNYFLGRGKNTTSDTESEPISCISVRVKAGTSRVKLMRIAVVREAHNDVGKEQSQAG